MSKSQSSYQAHAVDAKGNVNWSDAENAIWQKLMLRQTEAVRGKACSAYMEGIELLQLPQDRVPQLPEINRVLLQTTGWQTEPVPALIDFNTFFNLLANKRFPVATFIRRPEEMDYLQEPDIFHEIFGHCPLLTNQAFADFTETYGRLGAAASHQERVFLARLYWFTVEFGMIDNGDQRQIYGGGILSSPGETEYAYTSPIPKHKPFDLMEVLRTPYRINIMQPVYFCLQSIDQLFDIARMDIQAAVNEARQMGLLPAPYESLTLNSGELS